MEDRGAMEAAAGATTTAGDERTEVVREAVTMALYVAVSVYAVLVAVAERADHGNVRALSIVWGTAMGLALAHLFAFRVSAELVAKGSLTRQDVRVSLAQFAGAFVVAAIVTVPVVVFPTTAQFDVARLLLAGTIATAGYATARRHGATAARSWAHALIVLVVAVAVAVSKNVLSGH